MAKKKRDHRAAGDASAAKADVKATASEPVQDAGGNLGFAVVGIGASAGGLDAFKQFFAAMPPTSPMAFVLIQHLDPDHESLTAELLGKHTRMPVVQVEDEMQLKPSHVYVIPPNKYLTTSGETLFLTEPVERRGVRVPIDFFFRALADDQQERAIGIILTGSGSDGTLGLREIKAAGGMVMVQAPETSQFDGMPRSAIGTGMVDYVVPIDQMPDLLLRYVQHWYINGSFAPPPVVEKGPDDMTTILALLRARLKYDFTCYKKGTLTRRIQRRMGVNHIEELSQYVEFLRQDKDEVVALYKDLLIGVTNFFREPESWETLQRLVIEPLVREHRGDTPIRVWVPGCATGEEPYSIAMLLHEQLRTADKSFPLQIFASDIDQDALAFARAGIYPENIAADVTPERLRNFFIKGEHTYRINKEIRDSVVFAEQNVISDPPFSKLDLISCRNLLIYLEAEAQKRILALFHFALREGGYLFLGGSETINQHLDLFEPISRKCRISRRIGPTRHDRLEFPLNRTEPRQPAESQPELSEPRARRMASLAQKLVLHRFVPACVIIDRKGEVLYLHGPVDDYLQLPIGEPVSDLLAMARNGLRNKLRAAIHQSIRDSEPILVNGVRIKRGSRYVSIRFTIESLHQSKETEGLLLVSFQDESDPGTIVAPEIRVERHPPPTELEPDSVGNYEAVIHQLEDELRTTREDLQSTIEELETSNEEFKAANEEVTSINEELQSTNEELETSKEELQSLNEELQTVNNQLEQKLTELESTNNDLSNLLNCTDVPTLFLDCQFRLKRFTPSISRLLRIHEKDQGRHIGDFAHSFTDNELLPDAERVLQSLAASEKEVEDRQGHWFVRRIVPYRTEDNRIDGVVITFQDITARKQNEHMLSRMNDELERRVAERTVQANRLVEEAPDAMVICDRHGQILQVNRMTESMFGYSRDELVGRPVEMLLPETARGQHSQHRERFFTKPTARSMGAGLELFGHAKDGRDIPVEIQLNPFELNGQPVAVAAIRDVSERRRAREAQARLAVVVNDSSAAFVVLRLDGTIESWNRGAEQLLGYTAAEAIGQSFTRIYFAGNEDEFRQLLARLQRGEPVQDYETVRQCKDGKRIDVSLTASLVTDLAGRTSGVCCIARDVSERKRLEQQLAELADEERQRLGQDLHDSLGQQLAGLGMLASTIKYQLGPDSPQAKLAARLEEVAEAAKSQLRKIAKGLLPVEVDALGLHVALEEMAEVTHKLHNVACRFETADGVSVDDNFTATHLYLMAREAVHNAVKHANATQISIRLEANPDLRLEVRDDGVGLTDEAERSDGMGLRIIRHRCAVIGGRLTLSSADGGTVVACTVSRRGPVGKED